MDMRNWRKMLSGDMSPLKEKKEEAIIPENAIYRIHWRTGQRSNLVDHDGAIRRVNEQMNQTGWEWMKVINTETKQQQIVYEPKSGNRGFLHLKKLDENMLSEKAKFDIGMPSMGNGLTVYNRAKEEHGDYQKIAHIGRDRKVKYYVQNLPSDVKKQIEKAAKGKNQPMSATQPWMKTFDEGKLNETGEWDDSEGKEWLKHLEKSMKKLQSMTKGKAKFVRARGFDMYQGPVAVVKINGKAYEVWTTEDDEFWIDDYPVDNTSKRGLRKGFQGDLYDLADVIVNGGK